MYVGSAAWTLIAQSDWMTKVILLALFSTSVFCGAIIILKFLFFRRERYALKSLFERLKGTKTFQDYALAGSKFQGSVGGEFLKQGVSLVTMLAKKSQEGLSEKALAQGVIALSEQDVAYLEMQLDSIADSLISNCERHLPVLGTSAAVAPLVGLFGTIWGLIHAFVNISVEKTADIAVVAPGIAEALMTTLAGLMVAIPAMIFFHYFSNQFRRVEHQLFTLSDHFFMAVQQALT